MAVEPGPPLEVTLRPLTAADGPAVAALTALGQPTTGGPIRLHNRTRPEALATMLGPDSVAVAAELPGVEGIVGMGWMATGECWYEGALRPFAYLHNQVVHPGYRRRGIGKQTTAWRMALAREQHGEDLLFFARISPSNRASLAGARWWVKQRLDGLAVTWALGAPRRPPAALRGVEVRQAEAGEVDAFAEGNNECHREVNLFPPRSSAALQRRLAKEAFGRRLQECLVAVERGGRIVAGLTLTDAGLLAPVQIRYVHPLVRLGSLALRLVPPDDLMRPIRVRDFWFAPGREAAAATLWGSALWRWRERGNLFTITLDPRSAAATIVRPRLLGRAAPGVLVLAGPTLMQPERPVYVQHV